MTDDIIIYNIDNGGWGRLPPIEVTGRFIVTVQDETGGKEWRVIDRCGLPDEVLAEGAEIQTPDGLFLREADDDATIMLQAQRYGETASGCVKHCRLLRKWEHIIPKEGA